jgi:hypothetical protein
MKLTPEEKEFLRCHQHNYTSKELLAALNNIRKIKNEPSLTIYKINKFFESLGGKKKGSNKTTLESLKAFQVPRRRGKKVSCPTRLASDKLYLETQNDELSIPIDQLHSPELENVREKDLELGVLYYEDLKKEN